MTPARHKQTQRKRSGSGHGNNNKRPGAVDIWSVPGELPEAKPIDPSHEPGALLRSLGDPPMRDGSTAADVFVNVIERAAVIANALAFSAELLDSEPNA